MEARALGSASAGVAWPEKVDVKRKSEGLGGSSIYIYKIYIYKIYIYNIYKRYIYNIYIRDIYKIYIYI